MRVPLAFYLASVIIMGLAYAEGPAVITFGNGDRITGTLITGDLVHSASNADQTDGEMKLHLKSDFFEKTALAGSGAVESIMWDINNIPALGNAVITLNNKDVIQGKISNIGEADVTLDTVWAKNLIIRRSWIKSINFNNLGNIIYQGTTSLTGWTQLSPNSWYVKDGAFLSRENSVKLSRDMCLPSKIRLTTQLIGRAYPQLEIKIWALNAKHPGSNFLNLAITGNRFNLEKFEDGIYKTVFSGEARQHNFPYTLDVFADRDEDLYQIYVNGNLLVSDLDLEDEPGKEDKEASPVIPAVTVKGEFGKELTFNMVSMGSGIKGLQVSEWDGVSFGEKLPSADKGTSISKKDDEKEEGSYLILHNGDRLKGDITQTDDSLEVTSPHYKVKIPFNLVASLHMPEKGANATPDKDRPEESADEKSDEILLASTGIKTIMTLSDGSVVTAMLQEFKDNAFLIAIPHATDNCRIDTALVQKVVFHPKPEPPSKGPRTITLNEAAQMGLFLNGNVRIQGNIIINGEEVIIEGGDVFVDE